MENKSLKPSTSLENESQIYLSTMEKYFYFLHAKFEGSGIVAYVIHIDGTVKKELLEKALLLCQKRHPRLRATINKGEKGNLYFSIKKSGSVIPIPLEFYEGDSDKIVLSEEMSKARETIFDTEEGPLCKVNAYVFPEENASKVIGILHHSIIDSNSLYTFFNELFSQYEALEEKGVEGVSESEITPLPFISSEVADKKPSFKDILWYIFEQIKFLMKPRPIYLRGTETGAFPFFFKLALTEKQTQTLLARCEEESVSLQNALCATALLSAMNFVDEDKARLSCLMPIKTRKLFQKNISDEHIGCFVGSFRSFYNINKKESFWKLARKHKRDINNFLYKGKLFAILRIEKQAGLSEKTFRATPDNLRDTVIISNLGVSKIKPSYGSLEIKDMDLLGNARHQGSWFGIVTTIFRNRLNLSIGSIEVKPEKSEKFKERFQQVIKDIAGEAE